MADYNHQDDWFYEGKIGKNLAAYFKRNGYTILKDNSDKISARGADLIVSLEGHQEIIEIKGYPTTFHTRGPNKGKPKPTKPKLQAKHWFSEALLSSMFNYQRGDMKNNSILAVAFPLNERYRELIGKVEDFFTDNNLSFKVYFIDEEGTVTIDNLNKNERRQQLRQEIEIGEDSGFVSDFNSDTHLARLHKKHII